MQAREQCMFVLKLHMCFWCTDIFLFFLSPATSSKDVTTRLHAVPSIQPPSLLPSFSHSSTPSSVAYLLLLSSTLPSVEETPTGESRALQHSESTVVTSPFSAVSHHKYPTPPPLPSLCTSWCKSVLPGDEKPLKVCVHRGMGIIDHERVRMKMKEIT